MSVQTLSPKKTRRLARDLDEPTITRAWVDDTYDHQTIRFVTWDHEHGYYDRRTGNSQWYQLAILEPHLPSCYDDAGHLLPELEPFDDDGRWPTIGQG